jgi:spore coat protein U-like protein
MIPKLVIAGLIILAGVWLSQYLARCTVVWAFNENLPYPRRLALAVRLIVMFVAVVVAADHLDFARNVFLASFIILAGGLVLTTSLAVGLSASRGLGRYLEERDKTSNESERSLWSHL